MLPRLLILEPTDTALPNYKRCGIFKDYINRICRSENMSVIRDTDVHLPVQALIKRHYGSGFPDYVYPALIPMPGFTTSGRWLAEHRNVRVIADASDTDSFDKQVKRFGGAVIDVLVLRHLCVPIGYQNILKGMAENPGMFKNTQVRFIPPGIPLDAYVDRHAERDIDVTMVCTRHSAYRYHKHRRFMAEIVNDLPYKTFVGSVWDKEYINILNRTKIFIVDGSMRGHMVEKYLEGASCGAMLMGEVPTTTRVLLTNNTSIVEIPDFGKPECVEHFKERVAYFLKHPDERELIANEGKYRLLETYDQNAMVELFEMAIARNLKSGRDYVQIRF